MPAWLIIPAALLAAVIVWLFAGALIVAHEIDREERIAS